MNIVVFCEPTMASNVAMKQVISKNHDKIRLIVCSSQIKGKGRIKTIIKLLKKSSLSFFIYKLFESKFFTFMNKFGSLTNPKKYISIKRLAKKFDIPILDVNNVNDTGLLSRLDKIDPDYILVTVSQIFGKKIVERFHNKIVNSHGSILPKYRGAAQYFWYLKNREPKFGVTLHYIDVGLDSGDIIMQREFDYEEGLTAYELHYLIAIAYGKMFNEFLEKPILETVKQSNVKESYSSMPTKRDISEFKKDGGRLLSLRSFFRCV